MQNYIYFKKVTFIKWRLPSCQPPSWVFYLSSIYSQDTFLSFPTSWPSELLLSHQRPSVSFFGDVRSCRVVCAVLCFVISVVLDFVDLSLQYPLSVEFSWQKYWRGLPCPPPMDLPDPGIEPESPASPALQRVLYH